jgi:hypothetical protein
MSYGGYGRGYGRGLGMGLGPNMSPYCRWFPEMPRGWWANPAYASQMTAPPRNAMSQPNYGIMPSQMAPYSMQEYPSQVAYPPPVIAQQFQPQVTRQQPFFVPQTQYGPGFGRGMGMGLGGGLGMGMRYRRRMGQFRGGPYQY